MSRLFVLDAMGLAYRAYYAFIRRPLVNSRGENTSALFGFANTVLKIRHEERPEYWALAWDGPGPTHRHDRYADYKATRKPMPDDLLGLIPAIEDMAQALGLPVLEIPGVEADVTQTFVVSRERPVRSLDGRRKPPFIDAATLSPERIDVVGMKFQPPAGDQECAWNPARLEPENPGTCFNCVENLRLIQHVCAL